MFFLHYTELLSGIFAALLFCIFSYWRKWLDAGGACMAFAYAVVILWAGGWWLALPMVVFFIGGSLMSKLPTRASLHDSHHKKARNAMQVFCNGGIAAIAALFYGIFHQQEICIAYYASISISTTDTVSSEVGNFFKGKVVDIISWKPVPKGMSGGISWQGTLAGLLAALVMGFLFLAVPSANGSQPGFVIVVASGFCGMLLDSIMGSTLQAKYITRQGLLTEVEGDLVKLSSGWKWMTNDTVNLTANLLVSVAAFALACC